MSDCESRFPESGAKPRTRCYENSLLECLLVLGARRSGRRAGEESWTRQACRAHPHPHECVHSHAHPCTRARSRSPSSEFQDARKASTHVLQPVPSAGSPQTYSNLLLPQTLYRMRQGMPRREAHAWSEAQARALSVGAAATTLQRKWGFWFAHCSVPSTMTATGMS